MSTRLLVICAPGEARLAVVRDGALLDYALWRPGMPDQVGAVHLGRVQAVLPALGGAFVRLDDASGFLPLRAGSGMPSEGDAVCVRVVRASQGGKGPRLALEPDQTAAGTSARPGLLHPGPPPLLRLAALHPDAEIRADCRDPVAELGAPPGWQRRILHDPNPWSDDLAAAVAALGEPNLALPGGMQASIHPTPALVAIDVDGGSASGARAPKATAQFAANRAAIGPLLHQLRLRNLSGAILIDLAGLPSKKRAALRPELEQALANDPLRPSLLGFTALGLVEILRPRIHPPLHELLAGPHAAGLAALREMAARVAVPPHRLPRLFAGSGVVAALEADSPARAALAHAAGQKLVLVLDPSLPSTGWRLQHD